MPDGTASFDRSPDADFNERDTRLPWAELEQMVHLDPAGRGLASYRRDGAPLDAGQLRSAALSLAKAGRAVAIVTGFCVQTPDGIAAETDGPPGALYLSRALAALGCDVCLITDRIARPLIAHGIKLWKLDRVPLIEMPMFDSKDAAQRWTDDFFDSSRGRALSHLIAIERPSPSHNLESLAAQQPSPDALARFAQLVPPEHQGRCHNMRGESIEEFAAPTHLLFDAVAARKLPITTIGIGDGGNEIGMGSFAWAALVEAVGTQAAPRIAARVATDFAVIAGVSNWGAYALALATAVLRDVVKQGRDWDAARQQQLIESLVRDAGAVDGLTRQHQPTVDGLPLDVYLQPIESMRKLLGFATG
jgi:hypothetical protein